MTQTIDAFSLKGLLDKNEAILIDVREPDEFMAEHIPQATSIPLSVVSDALTGLTFPPNVKIVFQCLSGKRSQMGCTNAQSILGTGHDVYSLDGGINAWKACGLPVIGKGSGGISIFRQVQMIVGSLIFLCVFLGLTLSPNFFYLAGIFGGLLAIAGASGICLLASLLQRLPYNCGGNKRSGGGCRIGCRA